jgi:membrane fusion protein (multidrug efflux system)
MKLKTQVIATVIVVVTFAAAIGGYRSFMQQREAQAAPPGAPAKGASAKLGGGAAPPSLPVKVSAVARGQVDTEVSAVGSLIADESVMIRPEVDGRVAQLHFREGQSVGAGQKLVSIDAAEFQARLEASQAETKMDEATALRAEEMFAKKYISQQALDDARGSRERSHARAREAEVRLAKTVVLAPFSGVLGLQKVSAGAYVKAGEDIVRLEKISALKLDFRVPEAFLAQLRIGQQVKLRVDAYPKDDFAGQIYAMEPVVDVATRTVLLRAKVPNQDQRLRPGMFARVKLTLETRAAALVVPEEAIVPKGENFIVFKIEGGKAQAAPVKLGKRTPGQVEIVEGLSEGDSVVTDGVQKLRPGAPVMVLAGMAPAAAKAPDGAAAPATAPAPVAEKTGKDDGAAAAAPAKAKTPAAGKGGG